MNMKRPDVLTMSINIVCAYDPDEADEIYPFDADPYYTTAYSLIREAIVDRLQDLQVEDVDTIDWEDGDKLPEYINLEVEVSV